MGRVMAETTVQVMAQAKEEVMAQEMAQQKGNCRQHP
jgi:hypothetical protein